MKENKKQKFKDDDLFRFLSFFINKKLLKI